MVRPLEAPISSHANLDHKPVHPVSLHCGAFEAILLKAISVERHTSAPVPCSPLEANTVGLHPSVDWAQGSGCVLEGVMSRARSPGGWHHHSCSPAVPAHAPSAACCRPPAPGSSCRASPSAGPVGSQQASTLWPEASTLRVTTCHTPNAPNRMWKSWTSSATWVFPKA